MEAIEQGEDRQRQDERSHDEIRADGFDLVVLQRSKHYLHYCRSLDRIGDCVTCQLDSAREKGQKCNESIGIG